MSAGTRDWDAGTYDRVSAPQVEWAKALIERLDLSGEEAVLDAGCGSGRVSELLLERLPAGSLIAVDGSAAMLAQASERLGPGVPLIHADLLDLELDQPVDIVFSNAVFHWIDDHPRLFSRLAAALRPGGRIEAQCGGEGNVADLYAAARAVAARRSYRHFLEGVQPNHFASAEDTEAVLLRAGFEDVRCRLQPWPVRPPEPREFIRCVCLGAHLEALPAELREPFVDEVMEGLGPQPELAYVRLNISARKRATPA